MRLLVACEESREVTTAFRKLGHEAYSCDIVPTTGDYPKWHIRTLLKEEWGVSRLVHTCQTQEQDTCTKAGNLTKKDTRKVWKPRNFFMAIYNYPGRVAVENPLPSRVFELPPYNLV